MKPGTCEACGVVFRPLVKSPSGLRLCPECRHKRRLDPRARLVLAVVLLALVVLAACLAVFYDDYLHWEWS